MIRRLAIITAGAIGIWLGIHALRAFLAIMVFNVAEDLPASQLGLVGLAIWLVGLAAWLPARLIGFARAPLAFAVLFAAVTIGRQAINDELLTAIFAVGAVVAWLWWLPAYVDLAARRGAAGLIVPAVALGLALQVGGQLALHGLDVHVLIGAWGGAVALLLGGAFVAAHHVARRVPVKAAAVGRWGIAALLPFIFLQLTLLASLGRLQVLGGWDLTAAGVVAIAGVAAVALGAAWAPPVAVRIVVGIAAVALVAIALRGGSAALLVVPAQAGLGLLLAAALAPAAGSARQPRTYLAAAVGAALFFVLLFALYSDFSDSVGAVAWPLAAVLVAVPALARLRAPQAMPLGWSVRAALRLPAAVAIVGVGGLLLATLSPAPTAVLAAGPAPTTLTVFNYNIHQGIGRNGVPDLPRIAAIIEAADADIVTLQEVNRVWDLAGGVDAYAWLRWRLPGYHAVFGEMHGVHFGNAIFSRHPITDRGSERYPLGPSGTPRSFMWVTLATDTGAEMLVVTTHLTPYNRADEAAERDAQATRLLEFWTARGRPTAVFTGDYNAEPESDTIRRTVAAGLVDARALHGLGADWTFHSTGSLFSAPSSENIDYVFVTLDVDVLAAQVIQADASDHLPIVARIRIR